MITLAGLPARCRATRLLLAAALLLVGLALLGAPAAGQDGQGDVLRTDLEGIVTPVMADHLADAVGAAQTRGSQLLLVEMDTPGGLATSTRDIVRTFLNADVPVVVYVAPAGAQAASAGAFITFASHVAAMAPGTNIGAATPVGLGGADGEAGDLDRKVIEDAAASIQAIAETRDRDVEFAVDAVREGRSASASEAFEVGAVDLLADSRQALLDELDGQTVEVRPDGPEVTLDLADAVVTDYDMSATRSLLQTLANPEIALLLLSIGSLALIYEFASPGAIIPGVAGAVMLILGFYSLAVLPVEITGILLLLLALALFIAELFAPGVGVFAGGGAIALIFAAVFLFDEPTGVGVDLSFVIPIALAAGLLFVLMGRYAVRTLRSPKYAGSGGEVVGQTATVRQAAGRTGRVFLNGTYWRARALEGELTMGEQVEVVKLDGLELVVRQATADPTERAEP